jgi:hypothetical protein
MGRAERFLPNLKRALKERFGLGVLPHISIKLRQVAEA